MSDRFVTALLIGGALAFAISAALAAPQSAPAPTTSASAASAAGKAQPDAEQLLADSDRARGAELGGLHLQSSVTDYRGDQPGTTMQLDILADGDASLITFTEPPRVRGNRMLVQGRNMWFATPDVKKPVPISPRQRMLGEAANGDIATTRYSRDYTPTLAGEDTVDSHAVWVLDLRAKGPGVAYERIRYFVDKQTLLGLKAEFFSVGGQVLKTARMRYDHTLNAGGKPARLVSRMEITDGVEAAKRTVIEYTKAKAETVPASALTLAELARN